jgi:hypothetical protein
MSNALLTASTEYLVFERASPNTAVAMGIPHLLY